MAPVRRLVLVESVVGWDGCMEVGHRAIDSTHPTIITIINMKRPPHPTPPHPTVYAAGPAGAESQGGKAGGE